MSLQGSVVNVLFKKEHVPFPIHLILKETCFTDPFQFFKMNLSFLLFLQIESRFFSFEIVFGFANL